MAVKWNTIKAGDVLWEVRRERAGNTMLRRTASRTVKIIEINHDGGWARASWNSNPARTFYRGYIEKLRRSPAKKKPGEL